MQAFANYQRNSYDDAINAANRFITLHPGHRDSAYAYYLLAISQYEQINDVRRDQSKTITVTRPITPITVTRHSIVPWMIV